MTAYYNEFDPAAAHVLRALIDANLIAPGDVDQRSITEVTPNDVKGYTQCHFFAGCGAWSIAARSIGWPDSRELWTGSPPCQPFSVAGKQQGTDDSRHLWPDLYRLISSVRPDVIAGEQVSGAAGYEWFDGVASDLESSGYAAGAQDIPACAVDAPHKRNRLYWCGQMANAKGVDGRIFESKERNSAAESGRADGPEQIAARQVADPALGMQRASDTGISATPPADACTTRRQDGCTVADKGIGRREGRPESIIRSGRSTSTIANASSDLGNTKRTRLEGFGRHGEDARNAQQGRSVTEADGSSYWGDNWIECYDGKARRTKPSLCFLAHGMAFTDADLRGGSVTEFPKNRIEAWRLAGNAIVLQVAAVFLQSLMESSWQS